MTQEIIIITESTVTTTNTAPTVTPLDAEVAQAPSIIYDFEVNWTRGPWAGTSASGWFSYNDSSPQPSLQSFELILGGTQPVVVYNQNSEKSSLYWDGAGLNISELCGFPALVALYPNPLPSENDEEGYYISFGETASGRLMNVHSGCCFTYLGGGLVTYTKRVVEQAQAALVSTF